MPISPKTLRTWQRMLSGRRLDLLDPSPLDIEVEDIVRGFASAARWNEQTSGDHAFSVAKPVMHPSCSEQVAVKCRCLGNAAKGSCGVLRPHGLWVFFGKWSALKENCFSNAHFQLDRSVHWLCRQSRHFLSTR